MSGNDGSVIGAGEEEASREEEEYEERMEDEEERREIKPNPTFPTKKRKLLSPRWASEAVDEISGGVIEDSNNNKIMNPIDLAIIKDHSYAKTKKPRVEKTADHATKSSEFFEENDSEELPEDNSDEDEESSKVETGDKDSLCAGKTFSTLSEVQEFMQRYSMKMKVAFIRNSCNLKQVSF